MTLWWRSVSSHLINAIILTWLDGSISAFDRLTSRFRTSHPWLIKFLRLFIWHERRFGSQLVCKRRCLRRIPRGGPSSCFSLPLRSLRLSSLRAGDLIHAAISGRSPIESDANVTVGLIAREKVRIWMCLVSLVTMALCVGHYLLNTWGLFNWDSNRTGTLVSDETRYSHRCKNKNYWIGR